MLSIPKDCEPPMRLTRQSGRYASPANFNSNSNPVPSASVGEIPVLQPRLIKLLLVLLVTCTASLLHAQEYTSVVVFGDSLSDTGNVAHLTQEKYGVRIPGPLANYTDG